MLTASLAGVVLFTWSSWHLFFVKGTPFLSLVIVVTLGVLGGYGADYFHFPSMLGMLMTGMILRNLFPSWIVDIPHDWTSKLWTLSLAAVIARAGLSLEYKLLKKHAKIVILMGLVPLLMETFFIAGVAQKSFDFPLSWSFMMAFGIASISPGVVVPLILNLLETSGWSESRLPPLMLASVGVDVLIATTGFGVAMASAFPHEHHSSSWEWDEFWIFVSLEEILGGILLGAFVGCFAFVLNRLKYPEWISTASLFFVSSLIMAWVSSDGSHENRENQKE